MAVSAPELFARPPRGIIPLSKGGDLVIDFLQKVEGVYTNYGPGVTVTLAIETPTLTTAVATITGYHALCRVESTITDSIEPETKWRCVVSYPTVPTTEVVAMNGTISRADF